MKKILKNISRVLFSLLLIVSIFGTFNVLAEEVIFKITNISVKEKSDKVTVNDVSLSGGSIVNDIVFTDKDDYITYNITFKNNTSDKYKILSITDDNDSDYLDYTYDDLSNTELNAGDEKTFNLTITYKQETNNLTISDKAVSLTLTYEKEDGTTGSETITNPDNNATTGKVKESTKNITNPKTGDNVTTYIILGIISLVGLTITTVSKKHLSKSLMAIALVSSIALPLGVRADSDKFIIKFNNNIKDVDFKITYNANGGKFSDNSTTKVNSYADDEIIKISHTENIDDTGKKLFGVGEYWDNTNITGTDRVDKDNPDKLHVITIPGAEQITIDVYYSTNDHSTMYINEGIVYDVNSDEYDNAVYREYNGTGTEIFTVNGNEISNIKHETKVVQGDSVSFEFYSEATDNSAYGYYAIVSGSGIQSDGPYEEPTREGFIFKGWYDDPECTDGHEVDINSITSDKVVYAKWKDPNVLELGDDYCIGDECFYVLKKEDENHVTLISKQNIYTDDGPQQSQGDSWGGFVPPFVWNKTAYSNYPVDVYNTSSIKQHVDEYVDYLTNEYGVEVEGRLPNYDDLAYLGVDFDKLNEEESLANVPDWFKGNKFWTSYAVDEYNLYIIYHNKLATHDGSIYAHAGDTPFIRVVITLTLN